MTQSHDLAQDFFAALIDAHSRYEIPVAEIVRKTMRYYHLRARYPDTYQELLRENETSKRWWNQRRERLAEQGKCIYCGQGLLAPGTKMCQRCQDYYRAQNAKRKARWEAV